MVWKGLENKRKNKSVYLRIFQRLRVKWTLRTGAISDGKVDGERRAGGEVFDLNSSKLGGLMGVQA